MSAVELVDDQMDRSIDAERYPTLAKYTVRLLPPAGKIVGRDAERQQVLASLARPRLSNILLLAPPGSGKALPLATPIPTPTGWTTMGELSVGDDVLGQDGKPTRVTFLSEINETPELYDITFSDGSVVRACAEHQWKVSTLEQRDAARPSRRARTALRRQADEDRRTDLAALLEESLPEFVTAAELIELIADVRGNTWTKPVGLDTYLKREGVEHRDSRRDRPRVRRGKLETLNVRVVEFRTELAIKALMAQVRRKKTWSAEGPVAESVLNTRQLIDGGVRIGAENRTNYAVRVAAPLDLPEADLPMDPYALGVWLGDGSRYFREQAGVCSMDMPVIERVTQRGGFPVCRVEDIPGKASVYFFEGLGAALKRSGIDPFGEKHIPQVFLRASYEQRLELLRGLLDTDGTIDENGAIEVSFSTPRLAHDVEELVRTFGIKVTRKIRSAGYRNSAGELVECADRHRMHFTTTVPVFTLPRHVERMPSQVRLTQGLLYIESIEPAPTEPSRCIQVDNADHMYLAGEGFVPTHNTVLVQDTMLHDPDRTYLEVDLARMIGNSEIADHMAAEIKRLFDEAEAFAGAEGHELVLFIDEFHQVVQMSAAAVEALKPVLAASGARGLKIVAATTYEEWIEYIRPNKPLDERLQRVDLTPASRSMTIEILRNFAEEAGVADQLPKNSSGILGEIVDATDRYVPSSVQPRKSIGILDGMIGWHRVTGEPMSMSLMAKVLRQSTGVNLEFSVDGAKIKQMLDEKVFAQDLATRVISDQLQVVVAGLNDKKKPKGRFLLSGPTGVGKACAATELVPVTDGSGDGVRWKTHGELEPGDFVFDRSGRPTRVLGVFPQGVRELYRVTLSDGRHLDVDGDHLWGVYTSKTRRGLAAGRDVQPLVKSTKDLLSEGVVTVYPGDTRRHLKFFVPMNGAVQWPEAKLDVDPYVMGVLLGNGCLRGVELIVSSSDEYTVNRVADSFGARALRRSVKNYDWVFVIGSQGSRNKTLSCANALVSVPELIGGYSRDKRIPENYMTGSIQQRWELVRGLFDTDGTIESSGRFNVSYSTVSGGLAADVSRLLFSLGVSNSVSRRVRTKVDADGIERECVEYDVHVRVAEEGKPEFFALPRKLELARRAAVEKLSRSRVKKFDAVGIASIEKLPQPAEAVCIYVDNEEHLYQAGADCIVTHNTEVTKQLAAVLFGDDTNRLIRFDMSEFALDTSIDLFRSELTKRVVSMGDSVILLDEIEKASRTVTRLLLQVLDDGRLTDDYGRQVSFLDCYIIATTNAGSEIYTTINSYASDDTGSGEALEEYMKVIERSIRETNGFPAELLGRFDRIVPFQPLSDATKRRILQRGLDQLRQDVYDKHGVRLGIHKRVLEYLAIDVGEDAAEAGGARESMRALQGRVKVEVARYINRNPHDKLLLLEIEGEMRAENMSLRKSKARPVVRSGP